MKVSYKPGHPTAADIASLKSILVPAIYLDWNVFQYLQAPGAAEPLLSTVMDPEVRRALFVPYSEAHLLDAAAVWSDTSPENRAERLRLITFADGVVRSTLWAIGGCGDEAQHQLRPEPMWESVHARGLLTTRTELRDSAAALVPGLEGMVEAAVQGMLAQTERTVADVDPRGQALARAVAAATATALAGGLPAASDAGSIVMKALRPMFEQTVALLRDAGLSAQRLLHAAPSEAVPLLNEFFGRLDTPISLDDLLGGAANGTSPHPDDLGPMVLGLLGYYPEDKKKVRKALPGFLPDGGHARHALNSAVFVTGDVRLAMRVEAWAHHTGRGLDHGCWPVVCVVDPNDGDTFARTAEVVFTVAEAFAPEPTSTA